MLSEVRLETRVDGPNTVGRDQDFGIILSIVHTEAMGRAAKLGQYLTNDLNAGFAPPKKDKTPSLAKKMSAAQGPRDELEMHLTEALAPFFDIKSITFAAPDVKPRPAAKPGWEETVLAYLHVRAKDASVDKIPPVQLELKFLDLSGPVTIPAESAETVIKVATEGAAPRPAGKIEITQTLDNRQLPINGSLTLEVKATATGLVPELEELLDLASSKNAVAIKNINPREGLQVKELNTWGDQVAPTSERLWTVSLDGDAVRAATGPVDFRFPPPKAKDAAVVYQTYADMNLTPLPEPVTQIGKPLAPGEKARPANLLWFWIALPIVSILIVVAALALHFRRRKSGEGQPPRARDIFHMPKDVDGFAVVALLRRLRGSPLVKLQEPQRQELQGDIQRVEQACFGSSSASSISESDLRDVASKWLRLAD